MVYGLLGPSGCGKTTVLSCILGRVRLDSGEIYVGVNKRKDVGYMPQEVSLFLEFTIKEIFIFYGRLFGLTQEKIMERKNELGVLLQLPDWNQTIGSLSGGEQRRVSFAVALLHNPSLLILDEPTVGVDALLAHSMWQYLIRLTRVEGKTILITTHYIEEAKQCDTISLIRRGVNLIQASPSELMNSHASSTLEEIFLELSQKQESETKEIENHINENSKKPILLGPPPLQSNDWFDRDRFSAQLIKNVCWVQRNVPIMIFLLLLPALQSFLFCSTFGRDPTELKVAFLSDELGLNHILDDCHSPSFIKYSHNDDLNCSVPTSITCQFATKLETKMDLILYKDLNTAERDVRKNKVWGVIHVPLNFTAAIVERITKGLFASESCLEQGSVFIKMDMSNFIISTTLTRQMNESLMEALNTVLDRCDVNKEVSGVPIKMNDAIFGRTDPVYIHSGIPGFICGFCFYFTMIFTSGAIMMEKIIGLLERSLVAGMTHVEIVVAHIVVQFILMTCQTMIMLFVFYVCFSNPIVGDAKLIVALLFAVEIVGIAYGFFLTEVFTNDKMILYAAIGTVLTVFNIGGSLWPIEGMPLFIQSWLWAFPIIPAVQSYTSVSLKGYSLSTHSVYQGFVSCLFWTIIFAALTVIIAKLKKINSLSRTLKQLRQKV